MKNELWSLMHFKYEFLTMSKITAKLSKFVLAWVINYMVILIIPEISTFPTIFFTSPLYFLVAFGRPLPILVALIGILQYMPYLSLSFVINGSWHVSFGSILFVISLLLL